MKLRLFLAAILCSLIAAASAAAQCNCQPEPRQIAVTGTSDIFVEPDEAVLNLGVSTEAKTLAETAQAQERSMRAVLAILSDAGVEDKDVQTGRLQLGPQHNDKEKLIGYKAAQTLLVTLRDLSKYESLSRSLLEGGVNNVFGIEFRLSNSRKYADEARIAAVRAAREKAVAMAGELGVKVGKPLSIVESDADTYDTLQLKSNFALMAPGLTGGGDVNLAPTVSSGQVRVRAKVTIRFELE